MILEKSDLLAFALEADEETARYVYRLANAKISENGGLYAGFRRFPQDTAIADTAPLTEDVTDWIAAVRLPQSPDERKDKAIRNAMLYEVEKLGEFTATLRERLLESGGL